MRGKVAKRLREACRELGKPETTYRASVVEKEKPKLAIIDGVVQEVMHTVKCETWFIDHLCRRSVYQALKRSYVRD